MMNYNGLDDVKKNQSLVDHGPMGSTCNIQCREANCILLHHAMYHISFPVPFPFHFHFH